MPPNSNNNSNPDSFVIGGNSHDLSLEGVSYPSGGSVRPLPSAPHVPSVVVSAEVAAPPSRRQLVLIVTDGSPSMLGRSEGNLTKAEATAQATRELVDELLRSSVKGNFSIAWIPWAEKVLSSWGPKDLVSVPEGTNWDPTRFGGSGTRSASALDAAAQMARVYLDSAMEERLPASVVVLLLTDGEDGDPSSALRSAEQLRSIEGVTLAACRFGTSSSGNDLLQQMADPGFYQQVHNADELRRFFMKSVTQGGQRQLMPGGRN